MDAPDLLHFTDRPAAVLDGMKGAISRNGKGLRQRFVGQDHSRMLRSTVVFEWLLDRNNDWLLLANFTMRYIEAIKELVGRECMKAPSSARPCEFVKASPETMEWLRNYHMKHGMAWMSYQALPCSGLEESTYRLYYLTEIEKLTYLFLLNQTSYAHAAILQEHFLPLRAAPGDDVAMSSAASARTPVAWIENDTTCILASYRVFMWPFTRWLCLDSNHFVVPTPRLADSYYIPTCDDNSVPAANLGRMFDELLSIEVLVHAKHISPGGTSLGNHVKQATAFPKLPAVDPDTSKPLNRWSVYVVFVFIYMHYKLMMWNMLSQKQDPLVLGGLLEFISVSIDVLLDPRAVLPEHLRFESMSIMLQQLRAVVCMFQSSDSTLYMLRFFNSKSIHSSNQSQLTIRNLFICVLNIAQLLSERDEIPAAYRHGLYDASLKTPVLAQYCPPSMSQTLSRCSSIQVPAEYCSLLLTGTQAALVRMATKRSRWLMREVLQKDPDHMLDLIIGDAVHPIYTNSEPMTIVAMPNTFLALHAFRIHMSCAQVGLLTDSDKPMFVHDRLSLASAMVRGGPLLHHWLFGMRMAVETMNPPKPDDEAEELCLDLSHVREDDPADYVERMHILVDRIMPRLLVVAEQNGVLDECLLTLQFMGMRQLVMSHRGVVVFCSLSHRANTSRVERIKASRECEHGTLGISKLFAFVINQEEKKAITDIKCKLLHEVTHDHPFFTSLDTTKFASEMVPSVDRNSVDKNPKHTHVEIKDDTVTLIFNLVADLLKPTSDAIDDEQKQCDLHALCMFLTLKPVVQVDKSRLSKVLPWTVRGVNASRARSVYLDEHSSEIEPTHPIAHCKSDKQGLFTDSVLDRVTVYKVFALYGFTLEASQDKLFKALGQNRLYLRGAASSMHVTVPCNMAANMYVSDLSSVAAEHTLRRLSMCHRPMVDTLMSAMRTSINRYMDPLDQQVLNRKSTAKDKHRPKAAAAAANPSSSDFAAELDEAAARLTHQEEDSDHARRIKKQRTESSQLLDDPDPYTPSANDDYIHRPYNPLAAPTYNTHGSMSPAASAIPTRTIGNRDRNR